MRRLYGSDGPDWVVINNAHRPTLSKMMEETTERDYKVAITIADLHVNPLEWVKAANMFDAVLMRYLYSPYEKKSIMDRFTYYKKHDPRFYLDNIKKPVLHFPWFTDPGIYKPSEEKEYDVIFLGSYRKKVYPLRNRIVANLAKLCEEKGWKYLVRDRPPGDTLVRDIERLKSEGHIVGDIYAETVARSRIFIFGNSIFSYPLSKYFEITGSRTVAMADKPTSAEVLHFESGENYVEITLENWKKKLEYYLEDDQLCEEIARKGYDNTMKNHSSEVRARQLVDFLKQHQ
ncbi:MAG: glycosyltransferase [Candidatus Bathyarchaeota archaeon]|nr:glycosyltransferase [Candidatus Bathyarchaeota archaeon]